MTEMAVRRLLTHETRGSDAQVEIGVNDSTGIEDRRDQRRAWRSPRTLRLLSLTPFAVPTAEVLFVRDYVPALTATPPEIFGVPLGLVLELVLLGWAALGAALVWRAGSARLAQLAVFLFAPTAIVGLLFRPALIRLMQTLAV